MEESDLLRKIEELRQEIAGFMPLSASFEKNLDDYTRVELTYTSNAIEGNTLTRQQTALVVEKGIAVGGKKASEVQEAINHAKAWDFVKDFSSTSKSQSDITEAVLLHIHSLILSGIDDYNSGKYRHEPVRISGSLFVPPNYMKVPDLMADLMLWLHKDNADNAVSKAIEAHYRLVSIHPFTDGNGRTSRLLMNLVMAQGGYPPIVVRPEDREQYINALETAHTTERLDDYRRFMFQSAIRSLEDYLKLLDPLDEQIMKSPTASDEPEKLLKIGELAQETSETIHTIRYWTKEGLLAVKETTESGYQLYEPATAERIREIRKLQKQRYTLAEIKQTLKG